MDLNELRLYLHLCETLHFGKTSQECNISASALSRTVQRLEDEAGKKLLERDNRSVRLTREGKKFAEYARETLEKWRHLRESFYAENEKLEGELSIYGSVTACYSILPAILEKFRQRYPEVHISLKTGDAARAVHMAAGGNVDIAVAALPETLPEQLIFTALTTTPLIFIGPGFECAVSAQLAAEDIAWDTVPLIVPERGLARKRLDSWFREKQLRPRIYAQVSGNEAILAMVNLGCGAGIVPRLVLEKSPLRESLKYVPVTPGLEEYTVGICMRRKKMESPLALAFWRTAAENAPAADAGTEESSPRRESGKEKEQEEQ